MKVEQGTQVTINYNIHPLNTPVYQGNTKSFKVIFEVGKGKVSPVLEEAVIGKETGEQFCLEISGKKMFGPYETERIVPIPLDKLDVEGPLQPGQIFHYRDAKNRIQPFRVVKVSGDVVWADFNHPLEGERFLLTITIEDIKPAKEDRK